MCEIGELVGYTGQVKQVKVLGVMALLDEEETDWKVIVIDVNDPLAPKLNDVEDVERHLPGLLRATNEWFRIYKIPDGKPENQFAFTGECKNKKWVSPLFSFPFSSPLSECRFVDTAVQVRHGRCARVQRGLGEAHHWQDCRWQHRHVSPLRGKPHMEKHTALTRNSTNLTVEHSTSRVTPDQLPPLPQNQDLPPAPIDSSIDKWFFISGAAA